jgi:hypothetical protein
MTVNYTGICSDVECCKNACRWGWGIEDHVTCETWTSRQRCDTISNVSQAPYLYNVTMTGGSVWNGATLNNITVSGGSIGSYAKYTLTSRNSWGNHCTKVWGGCNEDSSGSNPSYGIVGSVNFNNNSWGIYSFSSSTVLTIDLKHSRGYKEGCITDYSYSDATDWK